MAGNFPCAHGPGIAKRIEDPVDVGVSLEDPVASHELTPLDGTACILRATLTSEMRSWAGSNGHVATLAAYTTRPRFTCSEP